MDRHSTLAASRAEARRLAAQPVSEVTPSRRDFAQYVATQRQALAVIGLLAGGPRRGAPPWTLPALLEHAQACDDAEVAALAVSTRGALTMDDVAAIAATVTAPILRTDIIVDPVQLFHARLHGIDAAVFPAAGVEASQLHDLVTVASSLHMASLIEVGSAEDVDRAVHLPHVLLGLRCVTGAGAIDIDATRQLATQAPRARTLVVLPALGSVAECAALRGCCDAVVVGDVLLDTADVDAAVRAIAGE